MKIYLFMIILIFFIFFFVWVIDLSCIYVVLFFFFVVILFFSGLINWGGMLSVVLYCFCVFNIEELVTFCVRVKVFVIEVFVCVFFLIFLFGIVIKLEKNRY